MWARSMAADVPRILLEIKKVLHNALRKEKCWPHYMRILCLDIGSKRIGVAVSDPLGWTAQPLTVLERRGGTGDFQAIEKVCRETEPELLLVGLPLDAEGEEGPQAQKVRAFTARMMEYLRSVAIEVPLTMWDERYSTAEAEARLIEADVTRKARKRVIDKMAAAAILADYLLVHENKTSDDEGVKG